MVKTISFGRKILIFWKLILLFQEHYDVFNTSQLTLAVMEGPLLEYCITEMLLFWPKVLILAEIDYFGRNIKSSIWSQNCFGQIIDRNCLPKSNQNVICPTTRQRKVWVPLRGSCRGCVPAQGGHHVNNNDNRRKSVSAKSPK